MRTTVKCTVCELFVVTYWTSVVKERWDICYHANLAEKVLGYPLCSVSLLTLTAISVDRLVTLFLGLRYRHVVSLSGNTSTHHSTGERERKLIDISFLFNIYTGSTSSKYEHRRASALSGNIQNIRICMREKTYRFCNLRK